jgi:hypothetical protein
VTAALAATWSNATVTPCHEIDPNCQMCVPGSNCSAAAPPAPSGAASFFCNAVAVACSNGRVLNVSLNYPGLVLASLPVEVNQLARLQRLGECVCLMRSGSRMQAWWRGRQKTTVPCALHAPLVQSCLVRPSRAAPCRTPGPT